MAIHLIQRIRDGGAEGAGPLCKFLLEGQVFSEFRACRAPEDWEKLLEALPEPEGLEAY